MTPAEIKRQRMWRELIRRARSLVRLHDAQPDMWQHAAPYLCGKDMTPQWNVLIEQCRRLAALDPEAPPD